jgi:hypothetical protein
VDELFDFEPPVFERDAPPLLLDDFVFDRDPCTLSFAELDFDELLFVLEELLRAFDADFAPDDFVFDAVAFDFDLDAVAFDFDFEADAFDFVADDFDLAELPFAFDVLLFDFDALFAFDDADFDFDADPRDFVELPFAFDVLLFDLEAADFDFDPDDFERADEPRDVAATARDASPAADASPSTTSPVTSSAEPATPNWSSSRSPVSLHSSVMKDLLRSVLRDDIPAH